MSMMSWGEFIFNINTAPYQNMARNRGFRFEKTERFNARSAYQFTGIGDDTINLSGVVYGGQIGSYQSFDEIDQSGKKGESETLIDGDGNIIGEYVLISFETTSTEFFDNGTPRKVEFTMALERVD